MTKDKSIALKLGLELVWWIFTALVVYIILRPIHKAMHVWPFETSNIVFIVVLITFARYTFLLPYTFLARQQLIKVALILAMFPLVFSLIGMINGFLVYIEDNTWEALTGHLPLDRKAGMESYLWNEMIFFGAGSVITCPVLAVRLFLSIWRQHNRGTV
ncbi:MAG: hypothetical protein R2792_09975 [Saprospiraceae bacterium]